jgi:tetraacyldisaccharide 4'-kinase
MSDMPGTLTQLWYGNARGAALLAPLAWLYGSVTGVRRRAYDLGVLRQMGVGCPVIVIGNLVVGGTGKTPLVAWLARQLQTRDFKVGIVSRGYGARGRVPRLVTATTSWREVGDEPLLLAQRTGCMTAVGADRVAAGRLLTSHGINVIVSDDGLQHLRLARHFRIVVVDGARGFGNGRLLPAGPLREPIRGLRQADAVVVNGAAPSEWLLGTCLHSGAAILQMQLVPGAAQALAGSASRTLESFRGTRLHAVAGIGNPARFFRELRSFGLEVIEHAFPDHHPLVASDLDFGDDLPVLMTEKDAVKCRGIADARLWYVPVTAQLSSKQTDELLMRVMRRLEAYRE